MLTKEEFNLAVDGKIDDIAWVPKGKVGWSEPGNKETDWPEGTVHRGSVGLHIFQDGHKPPMETENAFYIYSCIEVDQSVINGLAVDAATERKIVQCEFDALKSDMLKTLEEEMEKRALWYDNCYIYH